MTRHSQDDATQQKSSRTGDSPLHAWNDKLIEPGLEVAPVTDHDKQYINPVHEGDKEAINQDKKEVVTSQGYQIAPSQVQADEASFRHCKLCGLRRRWFWTLLVVALLLMALVIGLAVGLSSRASSKSSESTQTTPSAFPTPDEPSTTPSSDSLRIGGSLDPSWFSGSGAWNGTGSAFTWQEFAEEFDDDIADQVYDKVVYYQHHTGEIRWMRLTANDTQAWQQGPPDSEVASDAKNSTPISTVTMRWSTSMWHVFYIDSENQVRHRKGSNRSTAWDEGTTREAYLKAWDGDLVGMTACWGTGNDNPIRLFYASSNSTFEEYLWNMQDDTWRRQQSWKGFNGAAAVRCYIGSDKNTDRGANRYLILMNSDNQIEFWYQNKDDGSQDWRKCKHLRTQGGESSVTAAYKTLAKLRIDNAHPASSLGLTDNVIVWQEASTNLIKVKRIDWQGENTRTTDDFSPTEQYAGIAGTQLEVVTFDNFTHIFYQRTGNDLTRLYRESDLGLSSTWESMEMPV